MYKKGIINEEIGLIIYTTHIEANTIKKVSERIMNHLIKKIFKEMEVDPHDIPDYTQIEDHSEAKQVMKKALEDAIEEAVDKAPKSVAEAKEVLESDLFIEQKGIRSLVDKDARVGNKAKKQQFFGYKAEIAMTSETGIITEVTINPGSYVDGTDYETIYSNTIASGLKITDFYVNKAYFRKAILDSLKDNSITPYIPISASAYKINEDLYSYTKDSDTCSCVQGNETYKKKSDIKTETRQRMAWIQILF